MLRKISFFLLATIILYSCHLCFSSNLKKSFIALSKMHSCKSLDIGEGKTLKDSLKEIKRSCDHLEKLKNELEDSFNEEFNDKKIKKEQLLNHLKNCATVKDSVYFDFETQKQPQNKKSDMKNNPSAKDIQKKLNLFKWNEIKEEEEWEIIPENGQE